MNVIPLPSKESKCGSAAGAVCLPVAPRANNRIRFAPTCDRQHPLLPNQALAWLEDLLSRGVAVTLADIDGPGDPLAAPGPTLETLSLLARNHPEIALAVTTLGVGGEQSTDLLIEKGVSQVTLLVDAVDPKVAELLYAWIRPGQKTIPLAKGVETLQNEQAATAAAFARAGLAVLIRTTIYPGYNDGHAVEIARRMAALGATGMTVVPFRSAGEDETVLEEPGQELMAAIRDQVAEHINIITDPERLGPETGPARCAADCSKTITILPRPSKRRPNVAVVSSDGMDVDLHLGHANRILIYGPREDGLACLLETRLAPEPGSGGSRWEELADTLNDCFILLAASAGKKPREILSRRGIQVFITEDNIEGTVDVLYGSGKKRKKG